MSDPTTFGHLVACGVNDWLEGQDEPPLPLAEVHTVQQGFTSVTAWATDTETGQAYRVRIAVEVTPAQQVRDGFTVVRPQSRRTTTAGRCSCACASGGFCGGCGHAGCRGRR